MTEIDLKNFDLHCPYCQGRIERAKHPTETPHRGDFAFCTHCGGVGVFTDRTWRDGRGWQIRMPSRSESYLIARHEGIRILSENFQRRQAVRH